MLWIYGKYIFTFTLRTIRFKEYLRIQLSKWFYNFYANDKQSYTFTCRMLKKYSEMSSNICLQRALKPVPVFKPFPPWFSIKLRLDEQEFFRHFPLASAPFLFCPIFHSHSECTFPGGFFLRENVTSHTHWYFIFLFVCFPAFLSFASKLWQLSVSHINHIQLALVLCPLVSIARGIFTMNTAYFNFMLH